MKKVVPYAWVAAMIIPGVLCVGNYVHSLTMLDPQAAFNRGQYRDAIRAFQRVLVKKPDDTFSRVSLAMTYEAAGVPDRAMKEYKEAVLRNSDGLIAGLLAADLMVRDRTIGEASLKEWRRRQNAFDAAMKSRGAVEHLAGSESDTELDNDEIRYSLSALEQRAQANPSDADSHLGMGFAHWLASEPDRGKSDVEDMHKAVEEIRAALLLAPSDPLAHYGLILVNRGVAEKELEDGDQDARHLRAMMEALQQALRRLPNSSLPIAAITSSLYTPYVPRVCLKQVKGWARDHPGSAIANYSLAWLYMSNSRQAGAAIPGWDEQGEQPLKRAQSLARGWKRPSELAQVLAEAKRRTKSFLRVGAPVPGVGHIAPRGAKSKEK